ncbi:hypothetical protein PYCC9005_000631 [Savitreella phatthalungensis]
MRPLSLASLLVYTSRASAAVVERPDGSFGDDGIVAKHPDSPSETIATTELTASNFASSTAKGYWFVKFFSPWCPHCTHIAPFWEKAAREHLDQMVGVDMHMGSVDCTISGDLCDAHDVKGYPTMLLLKDDKVLDQYGNIAVEDPSVTIGQFIDEHVADISKAADPPSTQPKEAPVKPAADTRKDASPAGKTVPVLLDDDTTRTSPVNVLGESVSLSHEDFIDKVSNGGKPWFVKFYTDWCPHCRKMAAAWDTMAGDFKGKLDIGQVNCETEARLCKEIGVRAYPTLLYFSGEEHIEYQGLRSLGDLEAFAHKAAKSGVREVDATEFEEITAAEEVVFVYFADAATTTEDLSALRRNALALIGHAPLLLTRSPILANRFKVTMFPKLAVFRAGKPQYYPALSPADMRDHRRMLDWMQSVWLPLVPELTPENSHEITGGGKLVVLAALDPSSPDFASDKAAVRDAAEQFAERRAAEEAEDKRRGRVRKQKQLDAARKNQDYDSEYDAKHRRVDVERRPAVGFAWVDGVFWDKWLKAAFRIDIVSSTDLASTSSPQDTRPTRAAIIINDEDNQRYWDLDLHNQPFQLTTTAILDALQEVVGTGPPPKIQDPQNDPGQDFKPPKIGGRLKASSTRNSIEQAYFAARRAGRGHPWSGVLLVVVGVFVGVVVGMRRCSRRAGGRRMVRRSRRQQKRNTAFYYPSEEDSDLEIGNANGNPHRTGPLTGKQD